MIHILQNIHPVNTWIPNQLVNSILEIEIGAYQPFIILNLPIERTYHPTEIVKVHEVRLISPLRIAGINWTNNTEDDAAVIVPLYWKGNQLIRCMSQDEESP